MGNWVGKIFSVGRGEPNPQMQGTIVTSEAGDNRTLLSLPIELAKRLLEAAKTPIWLAEKSGRVLASNESARQYLRLESAVALNQLNLFNDLLKVEPRQIGQKIELGEHEVEMEVSRGDKKIRARIQWIAEPGCLMVQLETEPAVRTAPDAATQLTVQE